MNCDDLSKKDNNKAKSKMMKDIFSHLSKENNSKE